MSVHKVNARGSEPGGQVHDVIGIGFGPATLVFINEVTHVD